MKKMGMRSWYKNKTLRTWFFSMLLTGGVFMASCEKDEDTPQPAATGNASIQSTNTDTNNSSVSSADTSHFPSAQAGKIFNGMSGFTTPIDSGISTNGTVSPYGTNGPTGY